MIRVLLGVGLLVLLGTNGTGEEPAKPEPIPAPAHVQQLRDCLTELNRGLDIREIAVSADGSVAAFYSGKRGLLVYDLLTGKLRFEKPLELMYRPNLAVSPTGERVVVGRSYGSGEHLYCYRGTGERVEEQKVGTKQRSWEGQGIAFISPDRFAVGSRGGVQLWSIARQAIDRDWNIDFRPTTIASSGCESPLIVVGGATRHAVVIECEKLQKLPALRSDVWAVGVNPAGSVIATGDASGILRLYSREGFPERFKQFIASQRAVLSVQVSPDGKQVATIDGASKCACWDTQTGKQLFGPDCFPRLAAKGFYFGYILGGKALLCVGEQVRLFDPDSGAEYQFAPPKP
jgi:WD40 repeat protein